MQDDAKATQPDPKTAEAYRKAARDLHEIEGECEIDEGAAIGISDDGGAYVQAWVWVSDEEAGICSTPGCGNLLDDGEGYDGECGSCADKESDL